MKYEKVKEEEGSRWRENIVIETYLEKKEKGEQ
jgi:hypothetical protein